VSLSVSVSTEGERVPVAASRLAGVAERVLRAEGVSHALLSIAFVSSAKIASMNRKHLGKKGSTDVIAFALGSSGAGSPTIGDVYISVAVARRNAVRLRLAIREEVLRLVIHGTLHVVGYNHPEGEKRFTSDMWIRQEVLLRRCGSPSGAR
jgi:probable rRNA maturation factor